MSRKALVKVGMSVVLCIVALRVVDLRKLGETLASIPLWLAVALVVGYAAGQLLSSFKWWCLSHAGGVRAPFSVALKAYFIGTFVNCFGLGTIGGDLVRGLLLSPSPHQRAASLATVVADRAHGLVVLSLIGFCSVVLFGGSHLHPTLTGMIVALIICVILGWFLGPRVLLRLVPPTSRFRLQVEQLAMVLPQRAKPLFLVSVLSAAFHLSQIALHALILFGLGIPLSFSVLLVTVPFVNILATLPISWNGLGVRENSYIFFLAPAYLSHEQAVALGAIWLFAMTSSSLIGGVISVLTKDWQSSVRSSSAEDGYLDGSAPVTPPPLTTAAQPRA